MTHDVLIVGAGWAGSVCAERLASAGKKVLVIDKRPHVGGNAHDFYNEHGILVHSRGAHVWHNNSDEVQAYVSRFTTWRPYVHRVLAQTSRGLVPVPINVTTLKAFDGDLEAARQEMIVPYTRKQWGAYADQLSPTVLARIKTRDTADDRYFTDRYQGMPADGYTKLFERLLDHPNIEVRLNTPDAGGPPPRGEQIIWTGPIDQHFGYCHGSLPYRSARFEFVTEPVPQYQPVGVVNCPRADVPYTRIVEFRHMTGQAHDATTVAFEYPQADGEPFWPVPTTESATMYRQYEALGRTLPDVYFCGRLGRFSYMDMNQVVAQALKLSARLIAQEDRTMINGATQNDGDALDYDGPRMSPVPAAEPDAPSTLLAFPAAMQAVIDGHKVRRLEWHDPTDAGYLFAGRLHVSVGGLTHQWIVSDGDMLATDWVVAA